MANWISGTRNVPNASPHELIGRDQRPAFLTCPPAKASVLRRPITHLRGTALIRTIRSSVLLVTALAAAACSKKDSAPASAESATTSAQTAAASEPAGPDSAERADKLAKLAYANMEDAYLNDLAGQWAVSVRASSSFGEKAGEPFDSTAINSPWHVTGKPDQQHWTNNNQSIGTDWIEASYAKPVSATEVRVVLPDGAESLSKLELIDVTGASHTVWSGVNDDARESRGPRTWFVRKFDATTYQVKAVKLTIANAMQSGYKEIDAIQLVGK